MATANKYKLPSIKEVSELVKAIKGHIDNDCRVDEFSDTPGINLIVGFDPETSEWSYQTGDSSYSGSAYHYPIWGVAGVYRRSNSRDVAKDIINEIDDQIEI